MLSWSTKESPKTESIKNVIEELKKIYRMKLLPLESHYQFHDFHSPQLEDPDFDAKPMILLVGQYSTGKTTFIKYLLESDFPGIRIGPEPTTDRFIAVMFDEKEDIIPGNALVVDPKKQFRPLSKFGNAFLNRFQCSTLNSPVLNEISIIDTPGILSGEIQSVDRDYDFTGVLEWFAQRVDRIILFFDPHKLDMSDEFRKSIEALRGHDDKIRIVLNKSDTVDHQQLMRVYGALRCSLGKVLQTPEAARVYNGSFWDQPFRYNLKRKLFEAEEQDLFKDMQSLPRNAALRKLNDLIKRAKLAIVHAFIISELRKDMPSAFGKDGNKKDLIKNLGQVYDRIQREHQISPGDFPEIKKMQESLLHHDFVKFNNLKPELLEVVDKMLADDIAHLMELIPQEDNCTVIDPTTKEFISTDTTCHTLIGESDLQATPVTSLLSSSIDPVLTMEEIKEKVEQVVSSEENNTIKIVQLKKIEEKQYKSLIQQLAYKKSQEELKDLVIVLKDLGYLTTKLGELSDELKYYTEAAVCYQYVITIADERLSAKSENEFTEKMLTDSYQQLTYIQQLIYSAVDGVPKHAPIVQVESNGNNQLLSSLRSKVELELLKKNVDADNQAKVQMPLEEQARNILFKLRKEVEEIVTIESNRIQSVTSGNTGPGEPQQIAQQEQEIDFVEKTRKLFEKIATDMANFLKKLYEESEAELGERPCEYAVIGLGSMALKQITPYSDLEFAILTENEDYKQRSIENIDPKIKGYFKNLSHLVNFKMINLRESIIPTSKYGLDMSHLVHVAVNFDLGGKTPLGRIGGDKPYKLVKTVDQMLNYVRNEGDKISHIDKNLPYILENVCYVHGDEKLVETYKGKVTEFLHDKNKDDSQGRLNCEIRAIKLLKEGAVEIDYLQPTLGLKRKETAFKGDLDKLQPELLDTGGRLFDVKQEIYRLPDRMVYNLGLYYGIEGESSWDTVDKLASRGIINPQAAINLKYVINFSTTLRLKTYAHHKAQKDDMAIFPRPAETESEHKKQAQQIFHLSEEDLREQGGLFQYFYTALPLHEKLEDFCDRYQTLNDKSRKTFFKNTKFYVDNSVTKGFIHYRLAQYKEAQSNLEEALGNPQNQNKKVDWQVRNTLGNIYCSFGSANLAIEQYEYCLKICKSIYHDKPHHPSIADSLHNLGNGYDSKGKYDQAIKCYQKSLDMNWLIYKNQPDLRIVTCLDNLGTAHCNKGQYDQAIEYHEKSLKMWKVIYGEKEPNLSIAIPLNNLGSAYFGKRIFDQAIKYFEESLKIKKLIYKNEPNFDVAISLNNLGSAYGEKAQYDQEMKFTERFVKMNNFMYKYKLSIDVVNSIRNPVEACREKGKYDKAIQYHEESLKMRKIIYKGENHPEVAISFNNLGSVYYNKEQYDRALEYFEKSLNIRKLIHKEEPHPDVATSFNNLGTAYQKKGQFDQAIEYYEKSLKMMEGMYGTDDHPSIANSYNNLGIVHNNKVQYDQAIKCYKKSIMIYGDIPAKHNYPSIAASLVNIGHVYYDKGQYDEALYHISLGLKLISIFGDHPYQVGMQYFYQVVKSYKRFVAAPIALVTQGVAKLMPTTIYDSLTKAVALNLFEVTVHY